MHIETQIKITTSRKNSHNDYASFLYLKIANKLEDLECELTPILDNIIFNEELRLINLTDINRC